MNRIFVAAAAGLVPLVLAMPASADSTSGRVLSYDRVARSLVMNDRTVYTLSTETQIPETLSAGDEISVEFQSPGEDGIAKVVSITILDDQD